MDEIYKRISTLVPIGSPEKTAKAFGRCMSSGWAAAS